MGEAKRKQQNGDYGAAITSGVRRKIAAAALTLTGAKFEALMAELCEFAESTFATLKAKDPPRRTIACKEGCAYCCHLYVQVTPLEAIRLAQVVKAMAPAARDATIARVESAYARVRGKGAAARNLMALPCPLLVEGRCTVYGERPMACRGANSADVEACRANIASDSGPKVPAYIHQRMVFAAVGNGVAQGLRDMGAQETLLELIAGLKLALAHDDPLAAWRSGALDFAPARCVEAERQRAATAR
jgi:hypothetical protein